jgi:hypothetical protein
MFFRFHQLGKREIMPFGAGAEPGAAPENALVFTVREYLPWVYTLAPASARVSLLPAFLSRWAHQVWIALQGHR